MGGCSLAVRTWPPNPPAREAAPRAVPRALAAIVPGISDHGGRYGHLVEALRGAGIAVAALDTRGQGRSGGQRGHVTSFDEFVEDLDRFLARVRRDVVVGASAGTGAGSGTRGAPKVFLFGHSMGALIVLRYLAEGRGATAGIAGAIVSAPPFRVVVEVPRLKAALAGFLSRWTPWLSLANEIDPSVISRDPDAVRRYRDDPLTHGRITPRLYTELVAAAARTFASPSDHGGVPTLLYHGTGDRVADFRATRDFFERLPLKDKTLRLYEGAYHEVHNDIEPARQELLRDAVQWIEARL